jgi:hypothetical protein
MGELMPTDYVVPKTGWPDGPWMTEPDRLEWRAHGLLCLIVRSDSTGALCGYVGVPPGHPWHGKHNDNIEASVHGSLTYADRCADAICHVPMAGESDDVWWVGFDCAHAYDTMPGMMSSRLLGLTEYCDLAYVKDQVEKLAEQARAAATSV